MAYSFPLSAALFMDILPVKDISFDVPEAVEVSETDQGEVIAAALGSRLWQGKVTLGAMSEYETADVEAMLDVLRTAGGSFFCYDTRRPGPRHDRAGVLLGTSVPRIAAISADTRELSLSDLPAGYQLSRGDMLGFAYGADPERYALHRVAEPVTADGSGETGPFQVTPNIRAGAAVNQVVELIKPACKAIILPNSFEPGSRRSTWTRGMSFSWLQTLR